MTTLSLNHLIKIYNHHRVVNDVSLEISSGEVVGLLGPNGAGKTTTFYMAVGLIKPDGGDVYLDAQAITQDPMYRRARKGVGYLPQEPSIFKKLTVKENLMAILESLPISRHEQLHKADQLLVELGISRLTDQKAAVLSGGERRRLEITRALATDPAFILLDEPFAGVDPLAVIDIQKIIKHLAQRRIGVVISDHNVRETLGVCDRAYILSQGQIVESGSPEKIATSPLAKEIYLGQEFKL